jgi:hypothetical protein
MDTTKSGTATVTVSGDTPVNPPDDPLSGLAAYLATLAANTAAPPHTVVLAASVTINTADTNANGVWATINSTV